MEEIKCTSYEKREFIRYLKYAKEMKAKTKIKQGKFDDTYYDIQRIEILIKRVEGEAPKQEYIKDSLNHVHDYSNKEVGQQLYKKEYYENIVKGRKNENKK